MQNEPVKYTRIVAFGDGLSDQGRFGPLTNYRYPPSPPFDQGRWTSGRTWIERLAQKLGVGLSPDDNWAQGGATTGAYNVNEPLRQALALGADAPIRGLWQQVDAALARTPQLDPSALYSLWAGGHDFGSYLDFGQPDLRAVPPAQNIKFAILKLAAAGAQHFLIGNMPDLANTPQYHGTDKAPIAIELVTEHNKALHVVAQELRQTGLDITEFDGAAVFAEVATNPHRYGIKYVNEAFLPYDTINFSDPLAGGRPLPENRLGQDPSEFMSFWAVSAGTKVHEVLAERAATLLGL